MSKTTTISMRMETEKAEALKTEAKLAGKTINEVLDEKLAALSHTVILQQKYDDLLFENEQLLKMTTKRIPKKFRVSIGFTAQEYRALTEAADNAGCSRPEVIRKIVNTVNNAKAVNSVNNDRMPELAQEVTA